MRNVTKSLYVFIIACLNMLALNAQTTDVTSTYLGANAGFDTGFNFDKNTFVISGNHILDVEGWKNSTTATYTIAGTVEYGIPVGFNGGTQPPSVGYNNSVGGALALSTGWGEVLRYYKDVTLPAGKYAIVSAIYNTGSVTAGSSLVGWIPNDAGKESAMSTLNSFPVGVWVTDTVEFVIDDDNLAGKIQVGLQSIAGVGSGSTAKIIVDYIKLLSIDIDKSTLGSKIAEVEGLGYEGSPGESYMTNAVNAAKVIYDKPSPTLLELVQAIENIEAAVALYRNALLSDLKVGGVKITGFDSNKFAYSIVLKGDENSVIPQVDAAAIGAPAGATVAIEQVTKLPGTATITVTPATGKDGDKKVYTVQMKVNYLAGWDGDGASGVGSEPNKFGWKGTGTWGVAAVGNAGAINYYRDDSPSAGIRCLSRAVDSELYYPVSLKAGIIYEFSGGVNKFNLVTQNTFEINTSEDRKSGVVLGSDTKSAGNITQTFEFMVPEDGTYYLHWYNVGGNDRNTCYNLTLSTTDKKPLEVMFDSKGGSEVKPRYTTKGNVIIEPEAPTKEGSEFDGWWYTEDGFDMRWNFSIGIERDITMFAKWKSTTFYVVSFDSQGGSDVPQQDVRSGESVEEPGEPVKEGFEFLGWYNNDTEWNFSQSISGDLTLQAKWNSTSAIDETDAKTFAVNTVADGVIVTTIESVDVKVISIMGALVKATRIDEGETFIQLPAGIYIINGVKVLVR